jgi:DNA-binding NtrC family response regulator
MLLHIALAVDQPELESKLGKLLSRKDSIVEPVRNLRTFWKDITKRTSDLLIVSRGLIDKRALGRIQSLRESADAPAIVVLSQADNEEDRARFIAAGCEAALDCSLSAKKIAEAIDAILQRRRHVAAATFSVPQKPDTAQISDFVAQSPLMAQFVRLVPRIAKSDAAVLILGETGVGKERLAHVLHAESPRSNGPFVAVHCAALPETLLESELFGHEQGAFTGATRSRRGCFELAHQGTIFLDEIGEMHLHLQSKLLRVLENHEIRRLGSEHAVNVDVRIMAATNRDLEEEVSAKQFRRDLYYRLNVVSLTIPPLRDRIQDIPELVTSYIDYLGPRIGRHVSGIAKEALDALCRYSWPGNVRELINVVERAMLLSETDVITCDDLPQCIADTVPSAGALTQPKAFRYAEETLPGQWRQKPLKEARHELVEHFERAYLRALLQATNGRVGEAAKRAGIDARTLFGKMKLYGLSKKDFRNEAKEQ